MHAGRARALVVYSCSRPRSRRRRHNDWVARRGGGASKEAGSASKHVTHGAYLDSRIFNEIVEQPRNAGGNVG